MSNSVLTKNERECIVYMMDFLRNRGKSRLADRCERVFNNAQLGALSRSQCFSGVFREAAFNAIKLACGELDAQSVLEFSLLIHPDGELSLNPELSLAYDLPR